MGLEDPVTAPEPKKNCLRSTQTAIAQHWTVPPKHRTPEQDAAEEWLITFYLGKNRYYSLHWLPFSRWYLFFASFLVQFCIGSLYSWSVFNKPVDLHVYDDSTAGRAVNAFYIAVGVFGTTTAIMGPWIERHGPRAGVMLGTSSFLIGHFIVAIGVHHKAIAAIYIGYGIFCGFGMGLCYISPVSALQKWFPDYRGTAAGFAVGGYGAGSVVWAKVYLPCIDAVGLSSTFILIGCVMAFAMYVCAIVLRSPHHEFVVSGLNIHGEAVEEADELIHQGEKISAMSSHEYESITTPTAHDVQEIVEPTTATNTLVRKLTLIDAIKTPDFLCMYIMFFANQLYGLIVLSKLSSMCTDIFGKTAAQASDIVSVNGVFNCCGRLVFPLVSDVIVRKFNVEHSFSRKCLYYYALASQVIILGTIPILMRNNHYSAFVAEVFILTASYGGGFGTIPAFLTDMFGAFNIGAMHGLILTAWSIGGVVGGITFNHTYSNQISDGWEVHEAYIYTVRRIFVIVIIGFVIVFFVRTNAEDRFEPGYHLSMFGRRIISIKGKQEPQKDEPLLETAYFLVQFCIGSLYSWSVFNKPIDKHVYNDASAGFAVNAFYSAVGIFGTTTAIMGPWIERNGPRAGVVLGTSSFLIGHIIVAIGVHFKAIEAIYVGYGLFCGFGMGLCYIAPVSALQKWFPDYRGMAAGFAVGGYGAGAVVWAKVYRPCIEAVGVSSTFLIVGCVMSLTMYLCAIVLRTPHLEFTVGGLNIHGEVVDESVALTDSAERGSLTSKEMYKSVTAESEVDFIVNTNTQVRKMSLIEAIKSPDFLCMYLMFFANQIYGLVVLSKLSNMCTDIFGQTGDEAANIVSINGVFNCFGRLFFSLASDLVARNFNIEHAFARKCVFYTTLILQAIIVGTTPMLIRNNQYTAFVVEIFILTASYGGGFGTIPAFLTDMFGAFNIGAMHGLILTAWSIGGVVGGITFNNAYSRNIDAGVTIGEAYISTVSDIFIIVLAGFVVLLFVRTNPMDRFESGYHFSLFGKRVISIEGKQEPPNMDLRTQVV
ncbi:hypothetical protein JM18_003768 [Phytophthora kernoviae]|uniref:Major facilitator superfamily (MFS) profile domain-containing protein n=1 Tax=Phytophthora kernoviae TaxID=325452 RepID=A0A921VAR6_9STRA|nr:hypothetical protein JM18_003768 [Phytophthora kernoviae]